ncbi:uncharacterized protein LOC115771185 [Drosophila novamexicana]|uniref:uncharacterized protein LOC115771185 n=1 Tax=Drosophila novamexicana TaxID=47314 RepID=UPI0011E5B382|nr:uncharacterized protein LOC115771185 [Drosophila novamexicana]
MCMRSQLCLKSLAAICLTILLQFCCIEIGSTFDNGLLDSRKRTVLLISNLATSIFMIAIACLGYFIVFSQAIFLLLVLAICIGLFIFIKCNIWILYVTIGNSTETYPNYHIWFASTILWAALSLIVIVRLLIIRKRS